ncbi:MAG: leucine-rich repeat domain-containing protein [Gammaproteobacteria bacterium]|nr:leucine-rich repeat domain-containing protein [Gammaproteobacteria bacterium]
MNLKLSAFFVLLLIAGLVGCNRQYVVTVNNQSVYDPRFPAGLSQLSDPNLQGCVNLALAQQNISNSSELEVMSCANAEVTDLRGIEQFRNLRFLDLAGNRISDLQPLASLSQLSGLSIPFNSLTDISPLLEIASLTAAILTGNNELPCSQLDRLQERLGENVTRPDTCQN